jgi:hypothetical protein
MVDRSRLMGKFVKKTEFHPLTSSVEERTISAKFMKPFQQTTMNRFNTVIFRVSKLSLRSHPIRTFAASFRAKAADVRSGLEKNQMRAAG